MAKTKTNTNKSPPLSYKRTRWLLLAAFLSLCQIATAIPPPTVQAATKCSRASNLVPACGVLWGASSSSGITTLEGQVGRTFDIYTTYHDMSATNSGSIPNATDQSLIAGGRIMFVTWASREYGSGVNYTWAQVAAGAVDARLDANASRLKAMGNTKVMISFDTEFDRNNRISVDGPASDYVAAYRHVHDRLVSQGVTNVIWVWNPTGYSGNWSKLAGMYPGDSYVDWMGYDPYNFYECNGQGTWYDVSATFGSYYNWLDAGNLGSGAAAKPRILSEYGSHIDSANVNRNGDWYRSIPGVLASQFPKIKALSVYNDTGVCDTHVTATPQTLAGFTEAGQHDFTNQLQADPTPPNNPPSTPPTTPTTPSTPSGSTSTNSSSNSSNSRGSTIVSADGKVTKPGTPVSGSIEIAPSSPECGVPSVAVDGKPISGTKIDTTKLSNGQHQVTSTDDCGTSSQTIRVQNSVASVAKQRSKHVGLALAAGGSVIGGSFGLLTWRYPGLYIAVLHWVQDHKPRFPTIHYPRLHGI